MGKNVCADDVTLSHNLQNSNDFQSWYTRFTLLFWHSDRHRGFFLPTRTFLRCFFSSHEVHCDPMLAIINKLISGTTINSRKTNKTTNLELILRHFSFLFFFPLKRSVGKTGWGGGLNVCRGASLDPQHEFMFPIGLPYLSKHCNCSQHSLLVLLGRANFGMYHSLSLCVSQEHICDVY